ncbi:transmembrane protein [Salinisphaera sp. T5B8]|uniref:BPSS1780 family membrane protein n=1 Tax=Salinisphaera sp. T5B8 TaxID=1304154 RepID=UPI003342841C
MVDEASLEPVCRVGQAQRVSAGQGGVWWREAIELLSADTEHWIVATLILLACGLLVGLACAFVPYIGDLLTGLFVPVFSVGLLYLAYRVTYGHALVYRDVLIGLRQRTKALLLAGAAQVSLQVIGSLALLIVIGMSQSSVTMADFRMPAEQVDISGSLGVILFLVMLLAMFFYVAATWFQPALVFFGERGPVQALKQSLHAVLINWRAFTLYGLVSVGLSIVLVAVFAVLFSLINLWLGGMLGVLAHILVGIAALATSLFFIALMSLTIYTSFRDIFGLEADTGYVL